MSEPMPSNESDQKVGLLQTIVSVLAAAFGVSSERKRERDFKHGKASTFIIAGVIFTVVFVLCIIGAVRVALHAAGQ